MTLQNALFASRRVRVDQYRQKSVQPVCNLKRTISGNTDKQSYRRDPDLQRERGLDWRRRRGNLSQCINQRMTSADIRVTLKLRV